MKRIGLLNSFSQRESPPEYFENFVSVLEVWDEELEESHGFFKKYRDIQDSYVRDLGKLTHKLNHSKEKRLENSPAITSSLSHVLSGIWKGLESDSKSLGSSTQTLDNFILPNLIKRKVRWEETLISLDYSLSPILVIS